MEKVTVTDSSTNTYSVLVAAAQSGEPSAIQASHLSIFPYISSATGLPQTSGSRSTSHIGPGNFIFIGLHTDWRLERSQSYTMRDLQHAAERNDRQAFAQIAKAMIWSYHRSVDLTRAIDLALKLDMGPLAMDLAQEGRRLFPQDERIRQAAVVLTPPVILGARPRQIQDLEASQRWMKEHSSQYKGQWVAVRRGTLLGYAPTLKELYDRIGPEGKTASTIVVKVLE
jgi:hypothetical protein